MDVLAACRSCADLTTVAFFLTLGFLGACFVAFTWILARSIDRTLEIMRDEEEGERR